MGRAIDMEKDLEKLKLRVSTMEQRLDILKNSRAKKRKPVKN